MKLGSNYSIHKFFIFKLLFSIIRKILHSLFYLFYLQFFVKFSIKRSDYHNILLCNFSQLHSFLFTFKKVVQIFLYLHLLFPPSLNLIDIHQNSFNNYSILFQNFSLYLPTYIFYLLIFKFDRCLYNNYLIHKCNFVQKKFPKFLTSFIS